jgi:cytochrome b6-f complex iron-sulfur subunit
MTEIADPEVLLSDSAVICARRQLLLGAGVGGIALVAACSSSGSSGNSGTSSTSGGGGGSAGIIALSKVPADSAVSVQDSTGRTLLLTQSGGKLTALDATCTHQGCTVSPAGSGLVCPCHGSQFTLTGAVTSGPAPTALHVVAVKVISGQVVLA